MQRGTIASEKLRDCDNCIFSDNRYFLITVLFVKTTEMSVKNFAVLLCPPLWFSTEKLLQLSKNGSRRAQVDQNDIKFAFCLGNWSLGLIIPLNQIRYKDASDRDRIKPDTIWKTIFKYFKILSIHEIHKKF